MAGFDLEQLRTLVVVAETGSLTAAAPKVFLSQSSVSEQMRKLEERAGQALLSRSKSGVKATPAGERLLAYARQILALSDEAWRDLHGVNLHGELRLAITDYFRPADLAVLLRRLNERYPKLRLHVTIMKSGAIEEAYAKDEIDIGLSMRIPGKGQDAAQGRKLTHRILLRREALLWMGAEGMPMVSTEALRLLVLPETCSLRQFTERLLKRSGVPYVIAHVASGVAGLQLALAAGIGVACLNESALAPGVTRLANPDLPTLPDVEFCLLAPRPRESEFVGRVREVIAQSLM